MKSYEYKSLDFFQIYFKDEQVSHLYPFAIPYKNETLTDAFENQVISDLVPNSSADLIAVCSWRLAQKRGDCYRLTDKSLTLDKILNVDFDVACLTPRSPSHKALLMAHEWHGKAWDEAFEELKGFLKTIGIFVPEELTKAIYENHFIAKGGIYKRYVSECLNPAIAFIEGKEVFKANANYLTKKRDPKEIKDYQDKTGRQDWPICPFILERLFSIFCEGKGYKIINL